MRSILLLSILLWLVPLEAARVQSFSQDSSGKDQKDDKYFADSYSDFHKQMKEPSLLETKGESEKTCYRFTYSRSFHNPIVIRVTTNDDGTSLLVVKVGHQLDSGNFKVVSESNIKLTKEETATLLSAVDAANFWSMQSHVSGGGLDGAEWLIEGVKNQNYHAVERWSPKKGEYRKLGLRFLKLSRLKLPSSEIY